jgi:hypothetical protein
MKAGRATVVAAVILILSMSGAVASIFALDRLQKKSLSAQTLYINSPNVLRRLSLGYTGLLADIYWTRSVQYFGDQHHKNSTDFMLLAPLLQITTALDPKLLPAYEFGANFLAPKPPDGAGLPREALSLMKFGIQHNPDQWRLYYNLGFIYYTELKDYAGAAKAFEEGAKVPNTNGYMPILAARMAQHAGEFDTARMLWFTTYNNTKEASIRQNAVEHLQALRVDEDVTHLEELLAKYRQQTGRSPARISDLERAGFIHGTPLDVKGHPYLLTADGRIEVEDWRHIPFITKGLPPGAKTPQPIVNGK